MTGTALLRNVRWGATYGLAFACVYVLYVVILFVTRGAAPFERVGTSIRSVIVVYFVGGITAGGVVGLLRPLLVTRLGVMIVGAVAAMPVAAGIGWMQNGPLPQWHRNQWVTWLIYSLVMGPLSAAALWQVFHRPRADQNN